MLQGQFLVHFQIASCQHLSSNLNSFTFSYYELLDYYFVLFFFCFFVFRFVFSFKISIGKYGCRFCCVNNPFESNKILGFFFRYNIAKE